MISSSLRPTYIYFLDKLAAGGARKQAVHGAWLPISIWQPANPPPISPISANKFDSTEVNNQTNGQSFLPLQFQKYR
jgi:hypothetical protein